MWNKIMQDLREKARPNNDRQRELAKQITEMEEAISRKSARESDFICIERGYSLRRLDMRVRGWPLGSRNCPSLAILVHVFSRSFPFNVPPHKHFTCTILTCLH